MFKPRLILAALLAAASPALAQGDDMLIIAHRGASAERPEHTLAAYERAIDQGADYIEPDLVATKDLVLVARHENELSGTTDVARREEFEDRRREKTIDGRLVAGWFAEDFTLAELRTLRVKERVPSLRPANARFDGLWQVPTLTDIVALVRAKEAETGRRIGLYPELKHPNFLLQSEDIDLVDLLLREFGALGIKPEDPVFIQSFEIAPLQRLKQRGGGFRLVQLIEPLGGPADEPSMRYAEMVTPTGLAEVAKYADAVGAHIGMVLAPEGTPTSLVTDAKAAGLDVHAWTIRPENDFLPAMLRTGDDPRGKGCGDVKLAALLKAAGVAGVFSDGPLKGRNCP
ncbi:glycerophosphodiester phosphodiesterase family protein [Erythrobacter donghaensis]|uniref:glycerophosphodiester phosphodiesterase family protein n=1 Tax=Erythrobacter donghaensis TaxID=267135 RepID=UPI000A38ACC8|nr:glycerophosphodiester phosphodiesterase family protein [Erythrobacter donghaensis]